MYLMVAAKKGYSALQMQGLLGHSRYEPVWLVMHKIRKSMAKRASTYKLDGYIKFDDAFFAGHRAKPDEFLQASQQRRLIEMKRYWWH
ncbi:MAG: hypothetical protein RL660_3082 [Bacteroidota bacterium]|jgi:hypothetical protein